MNADNARSILDALHTAAFARGWNAHLDLNGPDSPPVLWVWPVGQDGALCCTVAPSGSVVCEDSDGISHGPHVFAPSNPAADVAELCKAWALEFGTPCPGARVSFGPLDALEAGWNDDAGDLARAAAAGELCRGQVQADGYTVAVEGYGAVNVWDILALDSAEVRG